MRTLLLLVSVALLSGCIWGKKKAPKNEPHVYPGNAPSIIFSDESEHAGGPVHQF